MTKAGENQAGFTLLEMLVVLAITAIVFGISAYSLSVLKGRASPERTAIAIAKLLNATRFEASDNGKSQTATIDLKDKVIRTTAADSEVRVPTDFELTVTIGEETVRNRRKLEIIFLPDGTSSGAEINITNKIGKSARIRTNWLTGLTAEVRSEP